MNFIPFRPEHFARINLQEHQRLTLSHLTVEWLTVLAYGGRAQSAELEGQIIASGGLVWTGPGVGFAWAALSKEAGRHFLKLHRGARRLFALEPRLKRLEAVTTVGFVQGRRWLELLGFACEGRLNGDGPNGDDHFLYARSA
jgi:hypothetical protein